MAENILNRHARAKQVAKAQCNYPCCWAKAIKRGMCDYHYKIWVRTEEARAAIQAPGRNVRFEDMSAIYVIGYLETSYVKIGISCDVKSRISTMQTGCPYSMLPFAAMFSGREEVLLLEALTHRTLIEVGMEFRGEWFEVPPVDAVAVIEKLAKKNDITLAGPQQMVTKLCELPYDHAVISERNVQLSKLRALEKSIAASLQRLSDAA